MTDAVIFVSVFVALFILRIVLATLFFFLIIPEGDRCPHCDAATIRVRNRGWNTLMPWFRTSWCYECGWDGLLRSGPLTPTADRPQEHVVGRR